MANTKLTLSLNKVVIEDAKNYAKSKNVSLSQLIEIYLLKITSNDKIESEPTPIVDQLSGIIELSNETNYKEIYTDYLIEKYK